MTFANPLLVGLLDKTVITGLSPRRLSREEALNLAAWLVTVADSLAVESPRFRLISNADGKQSFVSDDFATLLAEVQNS